MHARLSVCLFACLSVCIPVCLHVCVHVFYPSACEFVCLSVQKFGTGALRVTLRLRSAPAPLRLRSALEPPKSRPTRSFFAHMLMLCLHNA